MDPVQAKSPLDMPAEILATLVEISEEINSSLDLDEVLKKTATLVKRLVDYEIFGVMLLDESTQRLYHRFTIGYGEQASKDWLIPLGQGITGRRRRRAAPFASRTFAKTHDTSTSSTRSGRNWRFPWW